MEKQAREAKRQAREAASDKDLQCIMDGGVPVGGTCM
jgi:hypothetical protein